MPSLDYVAPSKEKCKLAVPKLKMNKKPEKKTKTTESNNKKEMKNEENYEKPEERNEIDYEDLVKVCTFSPYRKGKDQGDRLC